MAKQKKNARSAPLGSEVEHERYIAAISYLWVLSLVPLFLKRKSTFVQHHAKQGLVLFMAETLGTVIYWVPIIGQLLAVAFVLVSAYGIMAALKGETKELPFISTYTRYLNL
jgi:uncharacterized membrane protein